MNGFYEFIYGESFKSTVDQGDSTYIDPKQQPGDLTYINSPTQNKMVNQSNSSISQNQMMLLHNPNYLRNLSREDINKLMHDKSIPLAQWVDLYRRWGQLQNRKSQVATVNNKAKL